jgi:hypothetical protein
MSICGEVSSTATDEKQGANLNHGQHVLLLCSVLLGDSLENVQPKIRTSRVGLPNGPGIRGAHPPLRSTSGTQRAESLKGDACQSMIVSGKEKESHG